MLRGYIWNRTTRDRDSSIVFIGGNFVCMQVLTTACTPGIVTFIIVEIRVSWLRILGLEAVFQACLD